MMRSLTHFIIICGCFALMTGCTNHQVRVGMSATANLNLTEEDEPLPLVVRIYQLNDDAVFLKTAFADLWKNDMKALGDTLLIRDELVMNPAAQLQMDYQRHEQTRYLAVMGVFREPQEESWRAVKPVAKGFWARRFASKMTVYFKGNNLEIVD